MTDPDPVFDALADPTRRAVIRALADVGPSTLADLTRQLPVTRQAVAKHLAVLDRVGLVQATPAGRERKFRVDEARLGDAVAQLSSVGSAWDARLQRIKRIAETIQRQTNQQD